MLPLHLPQLSQSLHAFFMSTYTLALTSIHVPLGVSVFHEATRYSKGAVPIISLVKLPSAAPSLSATAPLPMASFISVFSKLPCIKSSAVVNSTRLPSTSLSAFSASAGTQISAIISANTKAAYLFIFQKASCLYIIGFIYCIIVLRLFQLV